MNLLRTALATVTNISISATARLKKRLGMAATGEDIDQYIKKYESYWKREEQIQEIDLDRCTSVTQLSSQLQKLIKDLPPQLERTFHNVADPVRDEDVDGEAARVELRVMQWNALAQALSQGADNFVKCPKEALDWNRRRMRLLEEIVGLDPDVLCMQEIDHFGFFMSTLKSVGYEGYFYPKPDSPALYSKHSNGPDGCALFFKKDKFKLIQCDSVNLKTYNQQMLTNQVCVICTLQSIQSPQKQFLVATTHFKAKSGYESLRYEQGKYLLEYLLEKSGSLKGIPVVVCGDFNADPTEPVYEEFCKSPLNMISTYRYLSTENVEPPFTTVKIRGDRGGGLSETCRTIDYIWATQDIRVVRLLKLPTRDEVGANALPSPHYPSDHLSLVADLLI